MLLRQNTKSMAALNMLTESNTTLKEKEIIKDRESDKENIKYDIEGPRPSEQDAPKNKIYLPYDEKHPNVADFDTYFPWACKQMMIAKRVIVTRIIQQDTKKQREKRGKTQFTSMAEIPGSSAHTLIPYASAAGTSEKPLSPSTLGPVDTQQNFLSMHTYYTGENLYQIKFNRNPTIPAAVIKIIGLIIQFYPNLNSIVINRGLNKNVLYQVAQLLPVSNISEITLDSCYLPELNYHILLEEPGQLTYLSLSRCKINDNVVKTIFDKLTYPLPASKSLSVLNLSSNSITDEGAGYIANTLRANRQLKYLNLADNLITDDGATNILSILKDFPLTEEERETSASNYIKYAMRKTDLVARYLKDMKVAKERKPTSTLKKAKSTASRTTSGQNNTLSESALASKAENLVRSVLGEYEDPYCKSETVAINGVLHCRGNNVLCYLNLSYNNLGIFTIQTLLQVLKHQKKLNRKPVGLINIRLDGNPMPDTCKELDDINDILEFSVATAVRTTRSVMRRPKALMPSIKSR